MKQKYLERLFEELSSIMAIQRDYLIELDSIVGDGDLGLTMSDGFMAAHKACVTFEGEDIGKCLYTCGKAMSIAANSMAISLVPPSNSISVRNLILFITLADMNRVNLLA